MEGGSYVYQIALALFQAIKDWPLLTVVVVCITIAFVVWITMRIWADVKKWQGARDLRRDALIQELSQHNGMLINEVETLRRERDAGNLALKERTEEVAILHAKLNAANTNLVRSEANERKALGELAASQRHVAELATSAERAVVHWVFAYTQLLGQLEQPDDPRIYDSPNIHPDQIAQDVQELKLPSASYERLLPWIEKYRRDFKEHRRSLF